MTRDDDMMVMVVVSIPTGKAPPNLSPGVPPILASQFVMGPGGLMPAYPVSGPTRILDHCSAALC